MALLNKITGPSGLKNTSQSVVRVAEECKESLRLPEKKDQNLARQINPDLLHHVGGPGRNQLVTHPKSRN